MTRVVFSYWSLVCVLCSIDFGHMRIQQLLGFKKKINWLYIDSSNNYDTSMYTCSSEAFGTDGKHHLYKIRNNIWNFQGRQETRQNSPFWWGLKYIHLSSWFMAYDLITSSHCLTQFQIKLYNVSCCTLSVQKIQPVADVRPTKVILNTVLLSPKRDILVKHKNVPLFYCWTQVKFRFRWSVGWVLGVGGGGVSWPVCMERWG